MAINPFKSLIDQLRAYVASEVAKRTQVPAIIITIEEIAKEQCWLVRQGNNGMTMYTIRQGQFYALSAEDMGIAPGSDARVDTYTERYAGAVLRSRIREQGNGGKP